MDRVPVIFIESVARNSSLTTSKGLQQLSSAWGSVGEVQTKKSGRLLLTFAPYEGGWNIPYDDWRLHYKMEGFGHIKTRTLSAEVVKEMAKSITFIKFDFFYYVEDLYESWNCINPDDIVLPQLLADLDAPEKRLDLIVLENAIFEDFKYIELRSKYSNLFRSFTSVASQCFHNTQLMEDTISEPKMRSVQIWDTSDGHRPTSFWMDYFFSEKCLSLSVKFKDFDIFLGAVDRWKKMDPRTLKYTKILSGSKKFIKSHVTRAILDSVGIRTIDMEAEAPLFDKVRSKVGRHRIIVSFHCIDHPVDPKSKIYVVICKDRKKHYVKYNHGDISYGYLYYDIVLVFD
uniref:FBA_2 domain-containing protein n=1 Tax=Steinernema glaseri TaxID=37863 RepID=A0A1I7ZVL9_9BILA